MGIDVATGSSTTKPKYVEDKASTQRGLAAAGMTSTPGNPLGGAAQAVAAPIRAPDPNVNGTQDPLNRWATTDQTSGGDPFHNPTNPAGANPVARAPAVAPTVAGPGDSIQQARDVRDNLLNQYNAATPRPAPATNGAVGQPVAPAANTSIGPAAQAAAPTVAAPTAIAPVTVGNAFQTMAPPEVKAQTIQGATIAPVAQVAPTTVAQTGPTNAERVDPGIQQANAAGQSDALALLRQAAQGQGPTAADAEFQKSLDKSIYAQRSLASSAHGTGRMAAALKAGGNIAQMTGQAAADAAALKAQEQQQARDQLLSGTTAARGQDIGLGTTNATLGTQVALANQGTGLATNLKQGDITAAGAEQNAAAANTAAGHQADLTQGAATDTAKLGLSAAQGNQSTATQVGISNTQASNQLEALQAQISSQQGIATAEQANQLKALQAQLTSGQQQFNAGQSNDLTKTGATLQNQTAIANLQESGANSRAQLASDTQTNLANLDSQLKSRGLDDTQRQALLQAYTQAANQATASGASIEQAQIAAKAAVDAATAGQPSLGQSILGGIFNVAGAALGGPGGNTIIKAITSDKRQKKDVQPLLDHYTKGAGDDEGAVDRLLADLHPVSFEYKHPAAVGEAPGRQAGVMAQDLEKSPMGRTMVIEDQGVKKIDPVHAVGALLAAMTVMNRNMKALKEARR